MWVVAIGVYALFCVPQLVRAIRTRRALHDVFGVYENVDKYIALCDDDDSSMQNEHMREIPRRDWRNFGRKFLNIIGGFVLWSVPGLELNLGQSTLQLSLLVCYPLMSLLFFCCLVIVIVGYLATVILCMAIKAPLIENPNRAGRRIIHITQVSQRA